MKRLIAAALITCASAAGAQEQVTVAQLFQYAVQLGNLANAQHAKIEALQAKVAGLEAAKATAESKVGVLESDMGLVIQRYDTLLRAIVINVCRSNKIITDNKWAMTLTGIQPITLVGHTCPADPATTRYYVPQYLSPEGPPIPPQ